jgi:hypothetical protein
MIRDVFPVFVTEPVTAPLTILKTTSLDTHPAPSILTAYWALLDAVLLRTLLDTLFLDDDPCIQISAYALFASFVLFLTLLADTLQKEALLRRIPA